MRIPEDKNEMVPAVMMESKIADKLEPEYFIVQLGHGTPLNDEFNILKVYDFPTENR